MDENRKYKLKIIDYHYETNFQLEQCFCSCWDKHFKDCPNFGKIEEEPERTLTLHFEDGSKITLVDFKYKGSSGA